MIWLMVPIIYALSIAVLPFPNWKSFRIVLAAVVSASGVTLRQRASMINYIAQDFALLPVWAFFWLADEIFFSGYHDSRIREPVFIVSQPRSGTTFLLRTLSEDKDTFLSVKHLEWRYPYISFWKLVEALRLRAWFEARSYWPNTELGRVCKKIHYHVLGNYEEFGIFLEERFYHHYFTFRRFPFEPVLGRVSSFASLGEAEKQRMVSTFLKVIKKVYFHRGNGEIFLAKENENVEFCQAVINRLEDARVLMICREPRPMLESYLTMSVTCTTVKHGIDPTGRSGWRELNMTFRRDQCLKFIAFWAGVQQSHKAFLVSFRDFTTDVLGSTVRIYRQFGFSIRPDFLARLEAIQAEQAGRDKGYANFSCDEPGFEFYSDFVAKSEQSSGEVRAV